MKPFALFGAALGWVRGAAWAAALFGGCGGAVGEGGRWGRLASLPDWLGVAGPFAGVSGGVLLVGGGANFPNRPPWEGGSKVWQDRVWALEQAEGVWREVGKLPRGLAYGVALAVGDDLWCLGGSDAGRHYAEGFSLQWRDGKLAVEEVPRLPIPLAHAAGAVDRAGTVYVAGGGEEPGEQRASNRVFACAVEGGGRRWRELPPLPAAPRFLAAAAAAGEAFYVLGGAALEEREGKVQRRPLREAWRYRAEDGWKRLADMPHPVMAAPSPAPVAEVPGLAGEPGRRSIFLLGGDDGSRAGAAPQAEHPGFPPRSWRYDIAADRWEEWAAVPAPRATVACAWWAGRFVLPSGEVRPGVRSPEVWTLSFPGHEGKGAP